jgi:hypothetical protein
VAGVLALTGASALAAGVRSEIGSFGPGGPGVGVFSKPQGVAVDQATGDVYVYDAGEEVDGEEVDGGIYKFNAAGAPEAFSSTATNVIKNVGDEAGEGKSEIAVDSSTGPDEGDIYVATREQVKIYAASGAELGTLTEEGEPCGVAVDPSGAVYVTFSEEEVIRKYVPVTNPVTSADYTSGLSEQAGVCNIAADSAGDIYAASPGGGVWKFEASSEPVIGTEIDAEGATLAVDPSSGEGYFDAKSYIAEDRLSYEPSGKLVGSFGQLNESYGVAVGDGSGDVYAADGEASEVVVFGPAAAGPKIDEESVSSVSSTSADLRAQIDPHGAETSYYFQYGPTTSYGTSIPVAPGDGLGAGGADQSVLQPAQGLAPGRVYHYRVVAVQDSEVLLGADQTFTTQVAGGEFALPDGREWEMVSPLDKGGAEPEAGAGNGFINQASEEGGAISYVADGPMPVDAEAEGSLSPNDSQILSTRGAQGWTSQDITLPADESNGVSEGGGQQYKLFSSDLALGLVKPFEGTHKLAGPPLSPPLSPDEVQEKTVSLRADAPLQPEESEVASYDAAKRNGELMHNPGYLALLSAQNAPGVATSESGLEGATPDLSHVVFNAEDEYTAPLEDELYEWGPGGALQPVSVLPGQTSEGKGDLGNFGSYDVRHAISNDGTLVFWTGSKSGEGLYVRDTETQETLRLDTVQEGASGAGEVEPVFQTASADGSKVFFTDRQRLTADSKAEGPRPDLYVVELSGGAVAGSQLKEKLTDLTPEGVNGESANVVGDVLGASEDGSSVYFVAEGALAAGAASGNIARENGQCSIGEPAFGTTCNLYVRHYNGTEWTPTQFIAALSSEDSPDWGTSEGFLTRMTARVSPDGQYLAFMSDRPLTGYDNADTNSGVADEEVFLYDASDEGHLVCASCDPTGARPAGILDNYGLREGEGYASKVDTNGTWDKRWLAGSVPGWTPASAGRTVYQARYLSNSGRLFFDSPDHLVPAATGYKEKVYEYEPAGVGSCGGERGCVGLISPGDSEHEAAFMDANASGSEVFFLTADRLVPQDTDNAFDVYDAHECTSSWPCPPGAGATPPACTTAESCREAPAAQPEIFGAPPSQTFSGSGNIATVSPKAVTPKRTAAQVKAEKLAKALKACKKKAKKKRAGCEKQARKQYGAKAHGKSKAKAKKSNGRGK